MGYLDLNGLNQFGNPESLGNGQVNSIEPRLSTNLISSVSQPFYSKS